MQFWHQHNLLSNQGFYFAVVIFWWGRAHSLIRITSNVILITNQAKSCCLIEENAVRYWVEGAANRDKASSIWPWLSSPLSSCTSSVTPSGSFSGSSWWLWLVSSLLSRCLPTSCMIKVPASSSVISNIWFLHSLSRFRIQWPGKLFADVQVECIKHADSYIPPLWIMCLESVAHLLVMLNFSSNFLIYCSVSKQFKSALSRLCSICSMNNAESGGVDASEYYSLHTTNLGIALCWPFKGKSSNKTLETLIINLF